MAPNILVRGDTRFLLVGDPPKLPIAIRPEKMFCQTIASELLHKYTGIDERWLTPKQIGIFEDLQSNRLTIGFGCIMPETINLLKEARWLSVAELNETRPDRPEILSYIASRL